MKIIHRAEIENYLLEINESSELLTIKNTAMPATVEPEVILQRKDAVEFAEWVLSKFGTTTPIQNKYHTDIKPHTVCGSIKETDLDRQQKEFMGSRKAVSTAPLPMHDVVEPPTRAADGVHHIYGEEVVDLAKLAKQTGSPIS
mgnify:CR=1 FL=1